MDREREIVLTASARPRLRWASQPEGGRVQDTPRNMSHSQVVEMRRRPGVRQAARGDDSRAEAETGKRPRVLGIVRIEVLAGSQRKVAWSGLRQALYHHNRHIVIKPAFRATSAPGRDMTHEAAGKFVSTAGGPHYLQNHEAARDRRNRHCRWSLR